MSKPKWKKHESEGAEAKRLCRLNAETVRMAQELGLNPRKLTKHIPSPSERWKAPVHEWIRELYAKRARKAAGGKSRSTQQEPETTNDRSRQATSGRARHSTPAIALPEDAQLPPAEFDVDGLPF